MATIYSNIKRNTAVKIIPYTGQTTIIESLLISNIHASDSVNIDLYIAHETDKSRNQDLPLGTSWDTESNSVIETYYILKNTNIPTGAALQLTKDDFSFDLSYFSVYLKLSASDSEVDIIGRTSNPKLKGY